MAELTLASIHGPLVPVDTVISLLREETDIAKVAKFEKQVEAAKRIDTANSERRNYWGELSIWSSRHLGELIRNGQKQGAIARPENGRPKKGLHDATLIAPATLDSLGIEKTQSHRAQKLADLPEEGLREYCAKQKAAGGEITKSGALKLTKGVEAAHVSANTGLPEWYTPPEYIAAAKQVMGGIDVDPASSAIAQKTVKAKRFYTVDDDGLAKKWKGRVWLNPPYTASLVDKFVHKLCDHVEAGDVAQGVLLTNNATETKWWQRASRMGSAVCFPAGRLKFLDEAGKPGAPLQGQALIYFGPTWRAFCDSFGGFGVCFPAGEHSQ